GAFATRGGNTQVRRMPAPERRAICSASGRAFSLTKEPSKGTRILRNMVTLHVARRTSFNPADPGERPAHFASLLHLASAVPPVRLPARVGSLARNRE